MDLATEPFYEENILGFQLTLHRKKHLESTPKDTLAKCQRLIEIGTMCKNKPWQLADRKTVSFLYLSIGVQVRWIFQGEKPHIMLETPLTSEFWTLAENAFIRAGELTIDRLVF